MPKDNDVDPEFEAMLKGKMGWKCDCSLEIVDKKSSLHEVLCKTCGKLFKTNSDTSLCFDCRKKRK
jgi:Zn finger protein HypA/HybF involved in hydrogenase expression